MTYRKRLLLLILLDSLFVFTAIYLSHLVLSTKYYFTPFLLISSLTLLLGHHALAAYYKLYRRVWEYASIGELVSISKIVSYAVLMTAVVQFLFYQDIYVRALVITWMLQMMFIGGSRFIWRLYRDTYLKVENQGERTLIIGAGSAGTMIARQLKNNKQSKLYPVAFIDDDCHKQQLEIMGIPVLGGVRDIEKLVIEFDIKNIVIAIPSLNKKELNKIVKESNKTSAKTQILPLIEDLVLGKVSVNDFRDVRIEDLLGREPVKLDDGNLLDKIQNQTILVTGAGGSIGSEICRQISKYKPAKVVLLGHGENSIYTIEQELLNTYNTIDFITEIADVQDKEKMFAILLKHKPSIVYHAAAHKHVPLMERNPEEAVKNNVIGTKNVAEAANYAKVNTFVMVSTDKAVNPTSVMGATKRIAEMVVQHMDTISNTRFVAVRFGNVLGSRGSVIPLFKKQIKAGGPVTVTHPDMERYFMTIPEASRLVIQAGSLARGGEIFVLDMGDPVKIVDLAKNLIELSGCSVEEIGIEFSGVRPGEKLYEELLNENEVHHKQVFPKIHIGKATAMDGEFLYRFINGLDNLPVDELRLTLLDVAHGRIREEKLVVNS
ncbi:polysaccharide biosynthesis protein [Chengkuizengella axinellae]|uniref:Nucleoside-diphosphate sugar epimerase/dehydratase n=1 Tax=Chengkuizengella axinellae TaxID=3064388 RepID=A0ABT9IZK7_9BACL|nr:nucleoside-diphosphate sugar epimerase/dehydratase [Chengkuizengella sp. 2205SS18-9]MDP5274745.1 nucleoside-diphosphate sugar epimerase/dehydratase [Chengkuizengella sp. 2205SS18-9]